MPDANESAMMLSGAPTATARLSGGFKMLVPMISGATMIYNQVLSAGFGVFLAALLGAETYGTVNLARNIFVNAVFLSPLGLDNALQRHLGHAASAEEGAAEVAWLRLVTFVVSTAVVCALWFGGGSLLENHVFRHPGFGLVLTLTMLALPFSTDLTVMGGAYRGVYRPIPNLFATYVVQPSMRVVAILALLWVVGGLWAAVWGTVLSFVVAWAVNACTALRDFPTTWRAIRQAAPAAARVLRYAPILGLSSFVFVMARTLDTMAIGAYATLADVGRYAVVLMVCQLVGTIGSALGQTIGTSIAAAHRAGDASRIVAILSQNMDLGSLLCAPFCVAIAVWGSDIDLILGSSYRAEPAVFAIAATTQWIYIVFHNCSAALNMTGRHKLELVNNIGALVVQAIGCAVLVPRFGVVGAAMATFVMVLGTNVARQVQIGRFLGDDLIQVRLVMPLLLSSLLAVPFTLLDVLLGMRAWWLTALLGGAYLATAFALLFAVVASPSQRERALALLNRRRAPT